MKTTLLHQSLLSLRALQIVTLILLGATVADGQSLKADKTIVAWGNNGYSQTNVPPDLTNAVAVAAGAYHSLALKADMTVIAWGQNTFGQTNVPANLTNAVAIARGWYHTLALKADTTVVAWGQNDYHQTNVPPNLTNVIAVAGGGQFSLARKIDKTVVAWGLNSEGQTNVPPNLTNVVAIAGGGFHCLALKADKTVVAWGRNMEGQTNVPPDLTNAVAVAAGDTFSMALKEDKTVVAWGNNLYGQTNVPPNLTNVIQISAGAHHALALKADKTVVAWGRNNFGQTNVPPDLTNVVDIAGGGYHNLALVQNSAYSQSYSIPIQAGLNLIANQLDQGSNTLNEIMPSVPNGCVLYKYDNASGTYHIDSFFDVWLELSTDQITLDPGEGAFLYSPTNFTLTFTGTPHVPVLPVTVPAGACYLLSRQTNDLGDYTNILGSAPPFNARVYKWTGSAYQIFAKGISGWSPSVPTAAVGESLWITVSGSAQPAPLFFKADNSTPLNQPGSWSVNQVPGTRDFGIWDRGVTAPNTTNDLGGDMTWGGIRILNPGGAIRLVGSNTLTLNGVDGIGCVLPQLIPATDDANYVACDVALGASQSWFIGGNRRLVVSGNIGGPGSLTKSGPGILMVNGTNAYAGATIVSSGVLALSGSLLGGGSVTVNSGAALAPVANLGSSGQDGVISGPVTIQSGGTLEASSFFDVYFDLSDDCFSTTISNSLSLGGSTILRLNRTNSPNCDQFSGMTIVTYGGNLTVTNRGPALQAGDSFKLFDAKNYAGNFAAISPATPGIGITWDFNPTKGTLTVQGVLTSFTNHIPISPYGSFVGDPLLTTPTSLGVLFPNGDGSLDGNMVYIYNCAGATTVYTFDSSWSSGFGDQFDIKEMPAPIINPGEGFRFVNQSSPIYNWIVTGTPGAPILPPPNYCSAGEFSLLCAQSISLPGNYQNITGFAPQEGAQEKIWNGTGFDIFTFTGGAWTPSIPRNLAACEAAFFLAPAPAMAGDKWKANTNIPLNQVTSWTNNAVPDVTEFGVWSSIVTAPNTTNLLGADMIWGGIRILNPGGPVLLTGSNTLTLNGVSGIGIDLTNATQDLTVNCPVTIASNQTWTIGGSRTLTVDQIAIGAPAQFGGPGNLRINNMHGKGVYPTEFSGSSRSEVGPGMIDGALSLVQSGPGTLALMGLGNYSGTTTVSNGTLQLVATASNTVAGVCVGLGTNTLSLVGPGAQVQVRLVADTNTTFTGGANPVTFGSVTLNVGPLTPGVSNQTVTLGAPALICSGASNTVTFAGNTNGYTLNVGVVKTHGGPTRIVTAGLDVHVAGISSNGVYPTEFSGSSYGSPSEIEWNFGDGGKYRGDTCGSIFGVASFTKSGPKSLILTETNDYSGPTFIRDGLLVLNGVLLGGSAVTVQDGGTLCGTGVISGPVIVQAGACLAPGGGPYDKSISNIGDGGIALNVRNTLSLAGTVLLGINRTNAPNSDQVTGITTVTYGGTLAVTNLGPALQAGDNFKLFNATNYAGNFAAISPATPGIGIVWDLRSLPVNGTLKVATVAANRTNVTWNASGGRLTLAWPEDHLGWSLEAQTNSLALGLSTNPTNWGIVAASSFVTSMTFTNNDIKAHFYRLRSP